MEHQKRRWYNKYFFPLVPVLSYEPGDNYKVSEFTFEWLFLKVWTLPTFGFQFSIVADFMQGVGIIIKVPYLRITLAIYLPALLSMRLDRRLFMKPKKK